MLGGIVSRRASPTAWCWTSREMYKSVEPWWKHFECLKWYETFRNAKKKKKSKKKINESCLKCLSCPEITFLGGGGPAMDRAPDRQTHIAAWDRKSLLAKHLMTSGHKLLA